MLRILVVDLQEAVAGPQPSIPLRHTPLLDVVHLNPTQLAVNDAKSVALPPPVQLNCFDIVAALILEGSGKATVRNSMTSTRDMRDCVFITHKVPPDSVSLNVLTVVRWNRQRCPLHGALQAIGLDSGAPHLIGL